MKQIVNDNGLIFTASKAKSVQKFNSLVTAYMGLSQNTGAILKELISSDPEMPLALCISGYFALLMGNSLSTKKALKISKKLNRYCSKSFVNHREKKHVAALSAWAAGHITEAINIWEQILTKYPLDSLALRLVHFAHFYSGNGVSMRNSTSSILQFWPEEHPDYSFILGMHAFGLEETGEYLEAEKFGRKAVELNLRDIWSAHSVAHVMEMTGRYKEGVKWVKDLKENWSSVNNFKFHLYWHQALYYLECGQFSKALDLYDEQIGIDINADFYLDMCNAASLLWRLELLGVPVGSRWKKLEEVALKHTRDMELIFISLHYLMVLIANKNFFEAENMIDHLTYWSSLDTTQSKVVAEVGLEIAKSLYLVEKKEFLIAAQKIGLVRNKMWQLGGSIAQRDLFEITFLEATRLGKKTAEAQKLYSERISEKPNSYGTWHKYCAVLKES